MNSFGTILPDAWHVFGPVTADDPLPPLRRFAALPHQLKVKQKMLLPQKGVAREGRLDLAPFVHGTANGKTAFVFIPFRMDHNGDVNFCFGADWRFKAYIDGACVCDTLEHGNVKTPVSIWNHRKRIRLKRGRHMVVIHFISGAASSVLCAAAFTDSDFKREVARLMKQRKFEAWPVDDLGRVFPHDMPPRNSATLRRAGWNISAAKNEYCVFQLGIRAQMELNDLEIVPGPLVKGRDVIPAGAIQVRWVGLVPVLKPDDAERPEYAPGWYPDPLLEAPSKDPWVSNKCARSLAVCCILHVPPQAAAGRYVGTVTLRYLGNVFEQLPLALEIWPFAIPKHPSFHITNWLWLDSMTQWHRCAPWSERHWKLLDCYAAKMAAYRQDTISTPALSGAGISNPMVLVDTIRAKDGKYRFDFHRLERWVKLFDRHGFRFFEMWHLADAKNGRFMPLFPFYDELKGKIIWREKLRVLSPEYRRLVGAFLDALSQWLDHRGLSERFLLHVYDEPGPATWAHYAAVSAFCRQHAPKLKQIDAIAQSDLITKFGADIEIPVPITNIVGWDLYYRRRAKEGKQMVWWYTCCGPEAPLANRFVAYPLISTRILSWQSFAFDISGYLHWAYNFWHRIDTDKGENGLPSLSTLGANTLLNPYREQFPGWALGDANIVYPHPRWWEEHGPISSLRYEAHRAGLQDYELLRMLPKVVADPRTPAIGAKASKLLAAVRGPIAGNLADFVRDGALFRRIRREIGNCIAANCGTKHCR